MKKRTKIFLIVLCCITVFNVIADRVVDYISSKSAYVEFCNGEDWEQYHSVAVYNGLDEYVQMRDCDYNKEPDITIRRGKNLVLSYFDYKMSGLEFMAYSEDKEMNYLFCNKEELLERTYGLYVKKSAVEQILAPTSENIVSVTVSGTDESMGEFEFTPRNKKTFNFFLNKFKKELNDYKASVYYDDEDYTYVWEKYYVYVVYQNGNLRRILKAINKKDYETFRSIYESDV